MSLNNSYESVILDLAVIKNHAVIAGIEAGSARIDPRAAVDRFGLTWMVVEDGEGAAADDPAVVSRGTLAAWIADIAAEDHGETPVTGCSARDGGAIAAIKFTSGSTGPPKGLEATLGSIEASLACVQSLFDHGADDNILVFLPLTLLQQRYWVYSALGNGHDVSVTSVGSVDDAGTVGRMARAVRPSVIMGVPAFYEAVHGILERGRADARDRGAAIRDFLGGGIRYLWTGSAPIGRPTLDFFNDNGVPLLEGYGLNETCIVAKNAPGRTRVGSAGRIVDHKTVRFDAQGVLIVGGTPPVNTAYTWCEPGDTEKMFLSTGEVFTRDIGHLDADGYLYIRGRIDDLIVLSSGFNILPRDIEEPIAQHSAVRSVVLHGHGRPFLVALVELHDGVEDRQGVREHVAAVNARGNPEQCVREVIFADRPFDSVAGLVSSQGKPVRGAIQAAYREALDAAYAVFPADQP